MRWRRAAAALCLGLALTGCWDRREINDMAFVLVSAVDREGDQYRATLQIPLPGKMGKAGGGGGERPWMVDSFVAPSIREANALQQKALSRQLYFAHRRVFLVGEEAARAGLEPIVDILARVPQNRLTSFVGMTLGPARHLLEVETPIEQFPAEMLRELATSSMKSPRTLKSLTEAMLTEGRDPMIPVMALRETDPGPAKLIQHVGFGVFRKNRLAGVLTEKDAVGLLWAMGETRNPGMMFPAPVGEGKIHVQFAEQRTKLIPSVQGDRISIHAVVYARGAVVENSGRYPLGQYDNLNRLERLVNEETKSMIEGVVKKLQTEYRSDPIGFGDLIHRHFPAVWHRIGDKWDERYPEVKFTVEPRVQIMHSASLLDPIGVPEEKLLK